MQVRISACNYRETEWKQSVENVVNLHPSLNLCASAGYCGNFERTINLT